MILKNCKVFLGDGEFHDCELLFGKTIDGAGKFEGEGLDLGGAYVVPGYVDIHSHGCMNRDFSDGDPEAMAVASSYYAQNGVTSFLATTMTLKEHQLMPAMACVKNAGALPGARCAGVNLEGPFLSYAKRGAQNPDNLHKPDADMFMRLHEASGGAVKLVTVAPEEEGGLEFVKRVSPVCTVSVGHTEADYDTAMRAYEAGASHATHLFNGMPGLHHRNPGVIGAAFDAGATVELICDGMHIHPSAVRCAMQLFEGRLALISDSLRCAGMPDGDYELGGLPIKLGGGVARLLDGTLAGSSINVGEAVRRAVKFGVPLERAIAAATSVPARAARLADCGELAPGKRADVVVLDADLNVKMVFVGGEKVVG